jgi:hypothetical protein
MATNIPSDIFLISLKISNDILVQRVGVGFLGFVGFPKYAKATCEMVTIM